MNRDDFDVGRDVVRRTVIQHFLGLRQPADHRTGDALPRENNVHGWDLHGFRRNPHTDHRPACFEHLQVSVAVVRGGERIQDEVELVGDGFGLRVICCENEVVGPQPQAVRLLRLRRAEHRDLGAKRRGELDPHVTEAAQPEDGDLMSFADLPPPKRRIHGDARAKERRCLVGRQVGRHLQDKPLVHDDRGGIAPLGDGLAVPLVEAVGEYQPVLTMLFKSICATFTLTAGIDLTAYANRVARPELLNLVADGGHFSDDFVPWDHRIKRHAEVIADKVDVRMAYPTVRDLDHYIAATGVPSLDTVRREWRTSVLRGISLGH